MIHVYYHYNHEGALIFSYRNNSGRCFDRCYLYYSFREALRRFRNECGLRYKHIKVIRLY